jgi:hypothetical protein
MLHSSVAIEVLVMRASSSASAAKAVDSWRVSNTRGLFCAASSGGLDTARVAARQQLARRRT